MISAGALLTIGIAAAAASFAGVAMVRSIATRRRWLDYPNERSSHTVVTPRGGGLAIVVVCEIASVFLLFRHSLLGRDWVVILSTAAAVAAVSWIDDLRPLSNRIRFCVHLGAAIIVLATFGGVYHSPLSTTQTPLVGLIASGVALLWIVGLTNAYNFMDGVDLMAAGQAIAAGAGWTVIGSITDSPDLTLIGIVIAASVAGFAIHNRPPARIFMGDVGSAFLGYLLATVALAGLRRDPVLGFAGILLVWPFVFDTSFTFFRRLWNREAVFRPHRSHLYQRLVIAGMTHMQVSLLFFTLALIGLGCSVALVTGVPRAPMISTIVIASSASLLWVYVARKEQRPRRAQP